MKTIRLSKLLFNNCQVQSKIAAYSAGFVFNKSSISSCSSCEPFPKGTVCFGLTAF